jgi:predicted Zn-dependent protease
VYFPKARALVALERYDEAVNVLRGHCEQLNDKSYALYVVMAEMYADQGAWNGVPWALQKAESLTPQRPAFVPRLLDVRERVRQTDEVSLESAPTDPGAPGPGP